MKQRVAAIAKTENRPFFVVSRWVFGQSGQNGDAATRMKLPKWRAFGEAGRHRHELTGRESSSRN